MCVKFQLSVSGSFRDIKGIVLSDGSVRLQTREWQFDPDSASQRQFPLLPHTAAIRYSLAATAPMATPQVAQPSCDFGIFLVHLVATFHVSCVKGHKPLTTLFWWEEKSSKCVI